MQIIDLNSARPHDPTSFATRPRFQQDRRDYFFAGNLWPLAAKACQTPCLVLHLLDSHDIAYKVAPFAQHNQALTTTATITATDTMRPL